MFISLATSELRLFMQHYGGGERMKEPIAIYEEARFESRRRFELFPDRIRVTGAGPGIARSDALLQLSGLRSDPDRVWVRKAMFRYGWMILCVAAFWAVLVILRDGPEALTQMSWVMAMVGPTACLGLVLTLFNARPVEFVRFPTDAGLVVLDVGRVGSQAVDFDSFVDALIAQIAETKTRA